MKKISLLKSFTVLSLLTFAITGFILVIFINNHMKNDMIDSEKESVHLTLRYILESDLDTADFSEVIEGPKKVRLNSSFMHLINMDTIMGVRIWSRDGQAIYSIGTKDTEGYFNKNGNSYMTSEDISGYKIINMPINADSGIAKSYKRVLRITLPISMGGNTAGTYEVIKPYEDIEGHLKAVSVNIFIIVFIGLVLLYLLLMKIVYDSSKTLILQNKELNISRKELEEAYNKLNSSYKSNISALIGAIDARDPYTAGHSRRVAEISLGIGKTLGLTEEELNTLELAALFHDVGKIGIEDRILRKTERLTDDEFDKIKQHPVIGVRLLENVDILKNTLNIILFHHERYGGGGYPNGYSGEEIPLESRIIAVADSYDAMTSDRPYRKGMSHDAAVEELTRCQGTQFDERVIKAFLKIESEIFSNNKLPV